MRRFDCEKTGYGKDAMDESEDGEWVLYSDHLEIVEAKNRAMSALYRELQRVNLDNKRLEVYEAALEAARSDLCWLADRHELPMLLSDTITTIRETLEKGSAK